jgi:hypothetical protein
LPPSFSVPADGFPEEIMDFFSTGVYNQMVTQLSSLFTGQIVEIEDYVTAMGLFEKPNLVKANTDLK